MPNNVMLQQPNKLEWLERFGNQTGNFLWQMMMAQQAAKMRASEQERMDKLELEKEQRKREFESNIKPQLYELGGKKFVQMGSRLLQVDEDSAKEENKPTADEKNYERGLRDPGFAEWQRNKPQWGADPNRPRDQRLQELQATNQLSNEFNNRSKEFLIVRDAYNRIGASSKEPSAAGDLALIFSYMKILDPGSTVREGEFANAQNAASVPERFRAMYNKVVNGERLSESTRNDFVKRSEMLYGAQEKTHRQLRGEFESKAKRFGLDPRDIVTDYLKPVETTVKEKRIDAPPEAIELLKKSPELKEAFKAKYGYLPEGF